MPSTVRTARAPTDLKPNLIRVKKRDDERAHCREGSEHVKEFQQFGDLRSSRRPPAHGMRRKAILLRAHAPTSGKRIFCKHLFDSYTQSIVQRNLADG